jgi:peroxiredoxin Q/BCP
MPGQAENSELKVGDKAPSFSLKDAAGKTVKLSDYKGKKVVLYFYPKDATPG